MADPLILFQPWRGQYYAHKVTTSPPGFSALPTALPSTHSFTLECESNMLTTLILPDRASRFSSITMHCTNQLSSRSAQPRKSEFMPLFFIAENFTLNSVYNGAKKKSFLNEHSYFSSLFKRQFSTFQTHFIKLKLRFSEKVIKSGRRLPQLLCTVKTKRKISLNEWIL